ncbi:glycosyltransferase family 2 protein [Candidatus Pelagibacter sp.]|uniref:glycosyltransferase family 2 protein n=1 Tax=Candidatus Pelagibacter sp. TaxID=2024849 RepID=UPI003F858B4F
MQKKLVSVIVPYYKKKYYFKKTFLSLKRQTYKNIEVIIIYDDKDLSEVKFIKKLILRDKRFKIIINRKNLGAGLSRNKGIRSSKGEFIAFLDADDVWKKNKLSTQIKFMNSKNIDCSHTSYEIINKQSDIIGLRKARHYFTLSSLLKSCDIGLSTVVIRSNIIKNKFEFPELKTKEDFVLWLNLLKKKVKIYGLKKNLSFWRKTNNSLSSSVYQKLKDAFSVYNKYMRFGVIKSILYVMLLSAYFLKKNV